MIHNSIAAKDYEAFCDFEYTGKEKLDSGVICVSTDKIKQFFETHGDNHHQYLLVSNCCDYGLNYQGQHPIKADFFKGIQMMDLREYDGMSSIVVPPRCNVNLCNPTDMYSMKCYAFTHSTFNKIPNNILYWYLVNKNIESTKIQSLPIGLYHEGAKEVIENLGGLPEKDSLLYVNYTNYTIERLELKQFFSQFSWATVDEGRRPFREFCLNTARFKYVLCPEGNGLDCHRNWEALYLGCVPVMKFSLFAESMFLHNDLPVLFVQDWSEVTEDFLNESWEQFRQQEFFVNPKLTLTYWKEEIARAKRELLR